jgi:murein DD-endopeptidase MepM/ murein hydrolase activator NlpD
VLHQVLHTDEETTALKHLMPGQQLHFHIDDQGLEKLKFEKNLVTTLLVQRDQDGFNSELVTTPLTTRVIQASATINDSLFMAGQEAGMSDNLIMQMVAIYGWDIDFVQDIRSGDHFKLIYQEQYKNGVKVKDGPILAAEFVNRGKAYRAVRYTSPDGRTDYYTENGASMRKAFLRTPLNFTRISSGFSLHRRHPILNTIRAHKGVDYAAPTGTPIKATGDGVVAFLGRKGGYGRVIVLKHGGRYSTLYGHMSAYARHLRTGDRVKQGQVIGYVGMSGLATGPHLHYEFRVNGVHRNPLTVKLPKAQSIPKQYLADFKLKTTTLLAELDQPEDNAPTVLAMRDKSSDESALPANY